MVISKKKRGRGRPSAWDLHQLIHALAAAAVAPSCIVDGELVIDPELAFQLAVGEVEDYTGWHSAKVMYALRGLQDRSGRRVPGDHDAEFVDHSGKLARPAFEAVSIALRRIFGPSGGMKPTSVERTLSKWFGDRDELAGHLGMLHFAVSTSRGNIWSIEEKK